jgi:glycerophosphoryl diester phosphodiesterase
VVLSTKPRRIFISGHRGTRVKAIENTASAFNYCLQNKIDYIEFDVKKTKDQQIVVFHDHRIDKLLDGTGPIEDLTLSELRIHHYKDGQSIQTLDEFFMQVGKAIRPMLEIKSRGISKQVIDIVHQFGYENDEILIQSFKPQDIIACYRIDPQYDYGLCIGPLGKFPIFQKKIAEYMFNRIVKPYPVKWLNLDGPFIYNEFIDIAVASGKKIILGAMKTSRYLPNLDRWNVEIVNADDPVQIREKIKNLGYLIE